MKTILLASLIAVGSIFATPLSIVAGSAPVCHYGTFNKSDSLNHCMSFARDAVTRQHYKVISRTDSALLAGDDNVLVEIACTQKADGSTSIMVTAFSADSKIAEGARNTVRESIMKMHRFD